MTPEQREFHGKGYPIIDTSNNIYAFGSTELPVKQPTAQEMKQFLDDIGAMDDATTMSMVPDHASGFALDNEPFKAVPWSSNY